MRRPLTHWRFTRSRKHILSPAPARASMLLAVFARLPKLPGAASLVLALSSPAATAVIKPTSEYYVPFACVFLAFVQIYLPFFVRLAILIPHDKLAYNNVTPRDAIDEYKEKELGEHKASLLKRAMGCHYNSIEVFAPFAASVLMCRASAVPASVVAPIAAQFVLWRALYQVIYLVGTTLPVSLTRSVVFHLGVYRILYLFALAY